MDRPDEIPLSLRQMRMWTANRQEQDSGALVIPLALRLSGMLDRAALRAALGDVAMRHEILRTVFPDSGGAPRQNILLAEAASPSFIVTQTTEPELAEMLAEEA